MECLLLGWRVNQGNICFLLYDMVEDLGEVFTASLHSWSGWTLCFPM